MKFFKLNSIGNDFVAIEYPDVIAIEGASLLAKSLCDRKYGVGADQAIFFAYNTAQQMAKVRFFNQDGSEAEMCGNGVRCVGKYVYDHKLTDKEEVDVETGAGIKHLVLNVKDGKVETVRVDMGEPIFSAKDIPVALDLDKVVDYPVTIGDREWKMTCVSMGNPHAVVFVDDVKNFEIEKYGPIFENNALFPKRTNTEFVEIISDSEVSMRVWERGSAETFACGTGTCACVMACILNNYTKDKVLVHLLGGDLVIEYDRESNHVFMTGPATEVFNGNI
jgi:diaminopimelate epimerase